MKQKFKLYIIIFLLLAAKTFVDSAQAQPSVTTTPADKVAGRISKKTAKPYPALSKPLYPQSTQLRDSAIAEYNDTKLSSGKSDILSLNEILTLCISFTSLVVSGITIIVGWKVYQKFLSQKLAENQLQVVLDLIKCIYDNVFNITTVRRHDSGVKGASYNYKNLFQLANSGTLEADSIYNYPILLLESHKFSFKPWAFLSNPLLPNPIAKKLLAFADSIVIRPAEPNELEMYMVIGKIKKDYTGPEVAISQFEGGLSGFSVHCAAIDFEIKKWLKNHGLTDLNQHVVSTEAKRWLV